MQLHTLFATNIVATKLSEEVQAEILSELNQPISSLKNRRNKDIPENTSDFNSNINYEFPKSFQQAVGGLIVPYGKDISPGFRGRVDKYWLQSYDNGDYHEPHQHSNSVISGAYYLEVEDPADIIFYNPDSTRSFMNDAYYQRRITPEAGMLLLFPSWLQHSVARTEDNNGRRLMMSFNVS